MQKTKQGVSKILLLVIIAFIIVMSAIMFGYGGNEVQDVKNDVQEKAQDVIDEKGAEVVENVVDNGQEIIGKKLKETGERLLAENDVPGFYGFYGEDGIEDYAQTILFFTVDWCPSCIDVDSEIQENQKRIPTEVAIVKVNFDEDEGLREVYGVEKQHTFILINQEGKEIKRWQNSKTLTEIISNID